MKIAIVIALAVLAIGADGAVIFVTPVTAAFTGSTTINEGSTSGTAYTVVAVTDQIAESVTFAIATQTVTGTFEISSTTGVITVASTSSIDYEQYTTQVLTVTGADSAATSTVTITIPIGDINDNTPMFGSTSMTASVIDGAVATTAVGTFAASDLDGTSPNNAITYSIASGNTGAIFDIASTGALTVASGKTTSASTTGCFSLTLQAVDGGTTARTGSAVLLVSVGSPGCSSASAVVGSLLLTLVGMLASLLQ